MRLPFLRPKAPPPDRARPPAAGREAAGAALARTQARRRLAGALVLLAIGVIGFPLLFETQPRPLPVDTPIELRTQDVTPSASAPAARKAQAVITPPADAGQELAPSVTAPPAEAASAIAADAPRAASSAAGAVGAKGRTASRPVATTAATAASAPASPRYVVQAGAYTDATALRSARQKIQRLGLESYTQVVEAGGTRRTRVRVGPWATRSEADAVAAKVRASGLPVSVLVL